mmetsp:Transcript_51802/g.105434  ORF Transcript_51802/g.105434 Transcript_51802/m.105434 type:complete len:236 (-) Transcript_51802:268-975(-)|eukprot:CAMPEP_0181292694 /NCGR_PEP_ID=MMETSP1101-20121128/2652_1 /TAXON_ID=46948 /ORGANISM="Rhodomonas abbreviata, Strain Caron Lab Isolate" /LENGTH=235 /DNA_ID=CAMNT_0023397199 /DNA_START=832 /DNA_END=1539 /DNA_ORIENTATION=-
MPPGCEAETAVVLRQGTAGLTAAQRLSTATVPVQRPAVSNSNDKKPPDQSNMSARERLRAHLNKNIQLQEQAKQAEKALATGEVALSPTTSMLSPTSAAALQMGLPLLNNANNKAKGLESLYAPIQDTRLGVEDISGETPPPPKGATPAEVLHAPIDMSLDAGGLERQEEECEECEEENGFNDSEPFLQSNEWGGLDAVDHLYNYGENPRSPPVVGVDDEWVQGLYDMEGMAPDA